MYVDLNSKKFQLLIEILINVKKYKFMGRLIFMNGIKDEINYDIKDIDKNLVAYIDENIFVKYEKFYSHGMIHVHNVIRNVLMLADYYGLDKNMCYAMASYHDIGLSKDRDNHEKESGKMFIEDSKMKEFFSPKELIIVKEAIEDHRGSRKEEPRSIYGKVLSDSDRDFDLYLLAKRQLATSIKNYPELHTAEEHFERCYQYISKRINETGHFNLWTNNPLLLKERENFEKMFFDKQLAHDIYCEEYARIEKDGTMEKIINYYEDY